MSCPRRRQAAACDGVEAGVGREVRIARGLAELIAEVANVGVERAGEIVVRAGDDAPTRSGWPRVGADDIGRRHRRRRRGEE